MNNLKLLFYKISKDYLKGKTNRSETAYRLSESTDYFNDSRISEDPFLANWYFAIDHLSDEYETTDREIEYYIECYEGKKTFSEKERDDVIING